MHICDIWKSHPTMLIIDCIPQRFCGVCWCDRVCCFLSNSETGSHQKPESSQNNSQLKAELNTPMLFCDINVGLFRTGTYQQVSVSLRCLPRPGPETRGVSVLSIKSVYGAAVGRLHADIAVAVRPGEPARTGGPSINQTDREYKPLGGREHTRPSSARFIALIYTLHWWIPHKWPIGIAGLKPHPQHHYSASQACASAEKVILWLLQYFFAIIQ